MLTTANKPTTLIIAIVKTNISLVKIGIGLLLAMSAAACSDSKPAGADPCDYVNPFIGTGGHGHTFPGASMPMGMV